MHSAGNQHYVSWSNWFADIITRRQQWDQQHGDDEEPKSKIKYLLLLVILYWWSKSSAKWIQPHNHIVGLETIYFNHWKIVVQLHQSLFEFNTLQSVDVIAFIYFDGYIIDAFSYMHASLYMQKCQWLYKLYTLQSSSTRIGYNLLPYNMAFKR